MRYYAIDAYGNAFGFEDMQEPPAVGTHGWLLPFSGGTRHFLCSEVPLEGVPWYQTLKQDTTE